MAEFKAKKDLIKKALGVVSLATGEKQDSIDGHALFTLTEGNLALHSTDKNRMAFSKLEVESLVDMQFTADPKKLLSLVNSASREDIKFDYNEETKTVDVFVSSSESAHISLPSFDPAEFLSFEDELEKAQKEKEINADIVKAGFKYIQGFLPNDEKNKRFSCVYLSEGVLYGSNGADRIGAFQSSDFIGIPLQSFRKSVLPNITSLIDRTETDNVILKTTSKIIMVTTGKGDSGFGFRKSVTEMPKLPIKLEVPETDTFNLDQALLLKKLGRFSVASGNDVGVNLKVGTDSVVLETLTERKSVETMPCSRTVGTETLEFVMKYKDLKEILSLYQASNLNFYIDKHTCTLRSEGKLQIVLEDGTVVEPLFTAVGLMSMGRAV